MVRTCRRPCGPRGFKVRNAPEGSVHHSGDGGQKACVAAVADPLSVAPIDHQPDPLEDAHVAGHPRLGGPKLGHEFAEAMLVAISEQSPGGQPGGFGQGVEKLDRPQHAFQSAYYGACCARTWVRRAGRGGKSYLWSPQGCRRNLTSTSVVHLLGEVLESALRFHLFACLAATLCIAVPADARTRRIRPPTGPRGKRLWRRSRPRKPRAPVRDPSPLLGDRWHARPSPNEAPLHASVVHPSAPARLRLPVGILNPAQCFFAA